MGLLALGLAAVTVNFILKRIILSAVSRYLDQKSDMDDRAAGWAATVVPLLIISRGITLVPNLTDDVTVLVTHIAQALIVVSVAMAIVRALGYANEL